MRRNTPNPIGETLGRLTVLEYYPGAKSPRVVAKVLCRCECGAEVLVHWQDLKSGHTKGCGKCRDYRHVDHCRKGYQSPEYRAWRDMKTRCRNPNFRQWQDYGGRGIDYCDRWESFATFLADMGTKPSPDLTLERVDNERGYEPSNCIWATRLQQRHNRRR